MTDVGIHSIGLFMPEHVRTNAWWPADEVERWRERMAHRATAAEDLPADVSPGARAALIGMAAYPDAFRGAVQRRVMDEAMTSAEMEARAARDALARAGITIDDVDVILGASMCPEYLHVNHACQAHHLLGMRQDCLVLSTEGICNSFALHLTLAESLVRSGTARRVLSLHSSAMTRVQGAHEPHSAWFGDGAAAVVIGPVAPGRGLRGAAHNADGRGCAALVLGVPGRRWWEAGPTSFHAVDHAATRAMLLGIVDHATAAIAGALNRAGHTAAEVGFYASHQGTPWLTEVTQREAGLGHARTLVTFPEYGNVSSVNLPLILGLAERAGTLTDDTLAVTFAGGTGETWSSLVLRWGR